MSTYSIHQAKSQLSKLIDAVQHGEQVIIAKGGKPVAVLKPLTPIPTRRIRGLLKDEVRVGPDFDEPLLADMLDAFEGKV